MDLRSAAKLSGLVTVLGISACAVAPVQEMSDARQALKAAEHVHAPENARFLYQDAQQQIEQAETALRNDRYNAARRHAKQAKDNAVKARIKSINKGG